MTGAKRKQIALALLPIAPFFAMASFAQGPSTGDETVLAIDTGRLVVMLNQVSALLRVGGAKEPTSEDPVLELDFAATRYDMLREVACARGVIEGPQCAETYAPKLHPRPVPAAVVRREVDDAEAHILPLWEAVCAKLDAPEHTVCQTE